MEFSKLIDPFKLIESALNLVINAFKAWRGFRLVIFGTTGVGKTTLWSYLQTEKVVDATAVRKTIEITPLDKFRLRSIRLSWIKVAILATDVPGDKEYRFTWREVLTNVRPHGIIFLMDNVEDTSNMPSDGFDKTRLIEHLEAFQFVTDLIMTDPQVAESLQAIAIVVNKSDTFPKELGYGKILEKAGISPIFKQYNEMEKCRSTAFQCSALYGNNVRNMINWMVKALTGNTDYD